jgi:hypothetical protein
LVASYPADGEGVGCDEIAQPDCGVPTNATITLRFDRYLDPATVNRQAIRVFTGGPGSGVGLPPFDVRYDPVERVVEFQMPSGDAYVSHALYRLQLVVPDEPGAAGIRAFDGAPLAEGDVPLRVSFFTAQGPGEVRTRTALSCDEVLEHVLGDPAAGGCSSAECHRGVGSSLGAAPEGLWLDSRANLRQSAIGRVAHETEFGDSAGVTTQKSPRFGVQMPIIDPKNPGNSYLLYKLLRQPKNFEPCPEDASSELCNGLDDPCVSDYPVLPLAEGECLEPSAEESARLREWFVRGDPMPLQRGLPRSVRVSGLRAISDFIAAGADCSD